jgi:tRNA-modifying protein YgfZ
MADLSSLARHAAVVWPAPAWETLVVTGPDRLSWLEGLVTCQLKNLAAGSATWGLVLNRQGKIQSVVWVVAGRDALWLALSPGTGAAMSSELGRMLIMEDAELSPPTEPQSWFCLHGPEAAALAARWAESFSGVAASLDLTGLGGAVLVVPRVNERAVLEAAAGQLLSDADWTRLRLERGLPEFGVDFDEKDRPHEASLDRRAVSWTKGCYLGQEVVCMQDMRGKVKRSLRVLKVAAPPSPPLSGGSIVRAQGGESIGSVTSSAYSELSGGWLLMAMVQLDALASELRHVDAQGGASPAVAAQPV